jgi:hypothetical protein
MPSLAAIRVKYLSPRGARRMGHFLAVLTAFMVSFMRSVGQARPVIRRVGRLGVGYYPSRPRSPLRLLDLT